MRCIPHHIRQKLQITTQEEMQLHQGCLHELIVFLSVAAPYPTNWYTKRITEILQIGQLT